MNILIIGGCQVYGYGLTLDQRSFLDQFVSELDAIGYCPRVTGYVFLPLADIRETLAQLDLSHFDLIIIQPAHYYLQHPSSFWKLFQTPRQKIPVHAGVGLQTADLNELRCRPTLPLDSTPADRVKQTKRLLKCLMLSAANQVGLVKRLLYVKNEVAALLAQLSMHHQKVFLLTPTPHRELVSQWLRRQGRKLIIKEASRWNMTVLDTHSIIQPQKEFYITDDPSHLNAIGHELVGRALFTCFEAKQEILARADRWEEMQATPALETV